MFEFRVQKYIRNRHFSSWDKTFVDQCYLYRAQSFLKTQHRTVNQVTVHLLWNKIPFIMFRQIYPWPPK